MDAEKRARIRDKRKFEAAFNNEIDYLGRMRAPEMERAERKAIKALEALASRRKSVISFRESSYDLLKRRTRYVLELQRDAIAAVAAAEGAKMFSTDCAGEREAPEFIAALRKLDSSISQDISGARLNWNDELPESVFMSLACLIHSIVEKTQWAECPQKYTNRDIVNTETEQGGNGL